MLHIMKCSTSSVCDSLCFVPTVSRVCYGVCYKYSGCPATIHSGQLRNIRLIGVQRVSIFNLEDFTSQNVGCELVWYLMSLNSDSTQKRNSLTPLLSISWHGLHIPFIQPTPANITTLTRTRNYIFKILMIFNDHIFRKTTFIGSEPKWTN